MANRSRPFLKDKFQTGDTPTEENFADLIDSFISKVDDSVLLDSNGNLSIPAGINLTNATNGQDGTLRFNGTNVEVFKGGSWTAIAGGGGGAFVPVGGGPSVAFAAGNVGIGSLSVPTHKLEVPLAANSGPAEQVRLGNLAVHTGQANDAAYISHQNKTENINFAVRQDSQANTTLNAGNGAVLAMSQGNVTRMQVLASGNISLSPTASVSIDGATVIGSPVTSRDLTVFGNASKPGGGSFLPTASDSRVKRDVRSLDYGLNQLNKLNPVYYKYNGEAGTPNDGKEYVGLIAQDVQKALPSLVMKSDGTSQPSKSDILTYDPNPIMFIMINAIKELNEKVEKLESQLAKSKAKG